LFDTYKDSHFVYLLLSYIEGGDFFDFLQDTPYCNSVTAQFYFGCLLLGIEYLHRNQVIYRDLKPENAVIDSRGYLALIDLGTAKFLQDDDESGFRTFTLIGTVFTM
jgi:serine/threonine protein kinase